MSKAALFWVLMVIAVVLGIYVHYGNTTSFSSAGMSLLELVLFGLLGWQVFGAAVK